MYLLRSRRKREVLIKSFVYVVLMVTSIIILIPIFWMLSTALKEDSEVYLFPPEWIPQKPQFGNFKRALTFIPFGRYFTNTSVITFATMV
ncbi:MAG TPA: carbohydrate ABC transporter permease, partial [bacterium]|nr:carbohydrate ABC transporter permease [bacterium]